jgi:acyl-coenzyme A thioesterase PaaI-like protein
MALTTTSAADFGTCRAKAFDGAPRQLVTTNSLRVTFEAHVQPGQPMTDLFGNKDFLPARLGVTAEYRDGEFSLQLHPRAELLRYGAVRASVVSFMIDVVAGIVLDDDPDAWLLTSDMSVRMRPLSAPDSIHTRSTILRRGRRSSTAAVELITDGGESVATGAIGFARVPRRETDPPKPTVSLEHTPAIFDGSSVLTRPLREEAGITVLDPMQGCVQMPVTPELCNTAGTLQGAMVALLAEAAAEELASARFDIAAVVTDLDLRYLAQTGTGTVRTRCCLLGSGSDAPIQIEIFDTSSDRLTTLIYARVATIST